MSLSRRRKAEAADPRRLPETLPAKCIGERCVRFSGVKCKSRFDLLHADGKSGGTDLPPFRDEATYAMYGQVCMNKTSEQLVEIHAEILQPSVNPLELIALAGRYGRELTVHLVQNNHQIRVTEIASSDAPQA